jgi:hypothetical protein
MEGGWGSDVWNKQLGRRYIISTVRAEIKGVVRWETALFRSRNLFLKSRLLTVHPVSEDAARLVHEWLRGFAEHEWLALERPELFRAELSFRPYLWGLIEEGRDIERMTNEADEARPGPMAEASRQNREEVMREIREKERDLIHEIERRVGRSSKGA